MFSKVLWEELGQSGVAYLSVSVIMSEFRYLAG